MSHGNTPMIGNRIQVATWNATTAPQAHGRVRRHSRNSTTVQSKSAPAQLSATAVGRSASSSPTSGRSDFAGSHSDIGRPRTNQSPCSLAIPAKQYTTPTWARTAHTAPTGTHLLWATSAAAGSTAAASSAPLALPVRERRQESTDQQRDTGSTTSSSPATVMNQ